MDDFKSLCFTLLPFRHGLLLLLVLAGCTAAPPESPRVQTSTPQPAPPAQASTAAASTAEASTDAAEPHPRPAAPAEASLPDETPAAARASGSAGENAATDSRGRRESPLPAAERNSVAAELPGAERDTPRLQWPAPRPVVPGRREPHRRHDAAQHDAAPPAAATPAAASPPKDAPPARRYDGRAGIAVRRLPYSDYRALLPHLRGIASWYGPNFHGKRTASGEVYNQFELTAAHLRLPMGTRVLVENLENRARVWVRINDRGPYKKKRVIDLSRAAAVRLGMIAKGTAPVRIAVVRWPDDMDPERGLKAYGQYVVQVAAYPDALKAEGERRSLKSRFATVLFRLSRTPRGLYSIYAGPFDDEQAARRISAALRKGGVHSLVRSYRK